MKNRLPFFVLAGVGLVVLWYFVAFTPYLAKRQILGAQLTEQRAQLNDFNNTLKQLPTAVQTQKELRRKLNEENSKLYAKGDLLRLFADLRSKAGVYNLHLLEISPPVSELLALNQTSPDSTAPQFLNMTVGLAGSYMELGQFVTDLEQSPYFRGVNTCSINGSATAPGTLQIYIGFKAMLGIVPEAS